MNRGKDCLKAHDYAVKITAAIATALKNARQQRQQRQGPQGLQSSSHSSNTNNSGTSETSPTSSKNSKPNANLEAGDEEISSPGRENASANKSNSDGDGVGKGQNDAGDQDDEGEEGKKSGSGEFRPVLTMVQHLCVAAPERAEGRARLASGIAALLPELEGSDRSRFVSFLSKVCCVGAVVSILLMVAGCSGDYSIRSSVTRAALAHPAIIISELEGFQLFGDLPLMH